MTSEVGTDLRAVRPPGTGLVVLTVESACSGEWRYFVMFAGVALSGKSPYLGGSRVWLSLWQEPGMWPEDLRGRFRACPLCGPFPLEVRGGCSPMTSEVGTDLRAVRPPGTGLVVLTVESACSGEWRYFVMFAGVALSGKSPYLGGSRVWLSLWQEPGMWPEDLRGRFRACPLCGPFPLEVRGGCSPMTSEVGTDLRAVRPCFGLSLAWG